MSHLRGLTLAPLLLCRQEFCEKWAFSSQLSFGAGKSFWEGRGLEMKIERRRSFVVISEDGRIDLCSQRKQGRRAAL